ncbi:hypothetical protein Tco_0682967 [Tanacetum coccineum]|uniref:Uncharacterized protein n=1 Tax=Tanacetum coccineum TaxID=301880 RepID=A0ABQ4XSR6_9ASTR
MSHITSFLLSLAAASHGVIENLRARSGWDLEMPEHCGAPNAIRDTLSRISDNSELLVIAVQSNKKILKCFVSVVNSEEKLRKNTARFFLENRMLLCSEKNYIVNYSNLISLEGDEERLEDVMDRLESSFDVLVTPCEAADKDKKEEGVVAHFFTKNGLDI